MKKFLVLSFLAAAALASPGVLRAEAPALFSPTPPEAEAAALVEAYLPLLAAGKFEQALALNDLRGMRQYLLERRLAELKAKNSELTDSDLEEMSAQIQLNDLNPARLQQILLGMMKNSHFEGLTWHIKGYAPAPEAPERYLVSIEARTAAGKEKPILLGIKKLGTQWLVSPEIIEELMGQQPLIRVTPSVPPPDAVVAIVDAFWKPWETGELNEAYGLFSMEYRRRVPVLAFLQQAQEVMSRIGIPTSWAIMNCREIAPATLGLGVTVQGSTASTPTIMLFRKIGETWVLEDGQFRPPSIGSPPPPSSGALPLSRPDLHPDLTPDLGLPTHTP